MDDLISGRKAKPDSKGGSRIKTPVKGWTPAYNQPAPRDQWERMPNVSAGNPQKSLDGGSRGLKKSTSKELNSVQAKAPSGTTFGYGDAFSSNGRTVKL